MKNWFFAPAAVLTVLAGCSGGSDPVSTTTDAVTSALSSVNVDPATCSPGKSGYDLDNAEALAVYECMKKRLFANYNAGDKGWIPDYFVTDYRDWVIANSAPSLAGVHGDRHLVTYVNGIGATQYLKFEEEGFEMPAGTVIAKESFHVDDEGQTSPGPLYLMQKVEKGTSPETGDWYYMAVSAAGNPMGINVFTGCNECHSTFEERDYLGYPLEETRIGSGL